MKYVIKSVQSIRLRAECTFEHDVLLKWLTSLCVQNNINVKSKYV